MRRAALAWRRDRAVQPLSLQALLLTLAVAGLAALQAPANAADVSLDAPSPSTAVPADNTYSGQSYITPERFPCPSNYKCAAVLLNTELTLVHRALQRMDMIVPSTSRAWLHLGTRLAFAGASYTSRQPAFPRSGLIRL